MTAAEVIFLTSVALIGYALFVYPMLALLLAGVMRRPVRRADIAPRVSFIIAAYNEEKVIREKIEQTLALDYPRDRREVIVASDGSTDGTDEIVRSFADHGVVLFRAEGRLGKTNAVNGAVEKATGEILVFSDATGVFSRGAIRELVAHLADPSVGCVTGRVAYRYGEDVTSRGFRLYQRIAVAVRRAESRWGSETSVSGSIHAMRRELYRPADPAHSLDVINAVHTVAAGRRVLYASEAVSLEESRRRIADEFRCRVRIGVRNATMVPYIVRTLLRPLRPVYLFQMASHKFLRWGMWVLLICALVSNGVLASGSEMYRWTFVAQCGLYLAGVAALVAGLRDVRIPGLSALMLFLVGNGAMAVGAIKALLGQRMPKWEPVR